METSIFFIASWRCSAIVTGVPSAGDVWGRQRRRSTGLAGPRVVHGEGDSGDDGDGKNDQHEPTIRMMDVKKWSMFTMDVHQFIAILIGQNDVLLRCEGGVPPYWPPTGTSSETWGSWQNQLQPFWNQSTAKSISHLQGHAGGRSTICSWLEICRTCSSRRCSWPAGRSYTASETDQLMFLVVFHGRLVVSTPMKNISNSQLGLLFPILKYTKIIDI